MPLSEVAEVPIGEVPAEAPGAVPPEATEAAPLCKPLVRLLLARRLRLSPPTERKGEAQ